MIHEFTYTSLNQYFRILHFLSEDFVTDGSLLLPLIISLGLFFLLAACIIVTITFIHRKIWNIRFAKAKKIREKYENYLAELISGEYENDVLQMLDEQQKSTLSLGVKDITQPFHRKILREQILLLHRNVHGKDAGRLRELYLSLGFKEEALKKLKVESWNVIVEAINELEQMNVREAYEPIFALILHKNKTVKTAAIRAKVRLDVAPLSFLDNHEDYLTDWQQSSIAYALLRLHRSDIPDFSQWLEHQNESVRVFAIKMCGLFNQGRAAGQIAMLLLAPHRLIVKAALNTLMLIGTNSEIPALIQAYAEVEEYLKPSVLQCLQILGNDTEIPFLEAQLHQPDNDIRLAAANALARLGADSRERLKFLFEDADEDLKEVITHALRV